MSNEKHIGTRVDSTRKRVVEIRARQAGFDNTSEYLRSLINEDLEGIEDQLLELIEQPA